MDPLDGGVPSISDTVEGGEEDGAAQPFTHSTPTRFHTWSSRQRAFSARHTPASSEEALRGRRTHTVFTGEDRQTPHDVAGRSSWGMGGARPEGARPIRETIPEAMKPLSRLAL